MEATILLILTSIAGFYMAWNIGANDVANSMGTSVGSRVITVKQAVILAAILNILGAVLVGSHVTNTVRKGIIDPLAYEGNPELFVYGMFSAILAAGLWVSIATYLRLPVSTTHSVVGALVGFGLISAGFSVIKYSKLASIVLSWVVSPLVGGFMAFILFTLISRVILKSDKPFESAKKMFPFIVALVFIVLALAVLIKGMHVEFDNLELLITVIIVGAVAGLISKLLLRFYERPDKDPYHSVENLFGYLQVLSACCVAFAAGANDVANAIGPLAAVFHVVYGLTAGVTEGLLQQPVEVPIWMLALGGIGIAVGIATWGYRVMTTIGEGITEITPTRGFTAEFSGATTVLACSLMGLPISTSHVIVGCVIGVGFARGITALNLGVVRNIVTSWLVTLPVAALFTMIIYQLLLHIL